MFKVGDLVKIVYPGEKPTDWALKAYKKGSVFCLVDNGEPSGLEQHKLFHGAMLLEENKYVILREDRIEKVG